jgi:hypothetical protein
MKQLAIISFFLFQVLLLSAQSSYHPGYIVLNSGDTLRGEIETTNWTINPTSIMFRGAGTSQHYQTGLLRAFGLDNGSQYQRFIFSYEPSVVELADATETLAGKAETKEAWLRLLYKGKYTLYEWATTKRKYFFVASDQHGIRELIYRVRLTTSGEMMKDEQFKNLLSNYAIAEGNEKNVQRHLTNANYNDKDLLRVFDQLNGQKSSFKETNDGRSKFDISAGGTVNFIKSGGGVFIDGTGAYAVNNAEFKTSFGFVLGFGFTYISKKNAPKVQPRIGVNLASLSLDGHNTKGGGGFEEETYKGSLLMIEPNFNLDLLLNPGNKNAALIGLTFGYNVIISNSFEGVFKNPLVTVTRENKPPVDGGFMNIGLSGTLAGNWGRLNLRVCARTNMIEAQSATLKGPGISLTYGYYLKK